MKQFIHITILVLIFTACSPSSTAIQTAIAQTQTAIPPTEVVVSVPTVIIPTMTQQLTQTITPLLTETQTPIPPTQVPVTVDMLQNAMLNSGYSRSPFNSSLRPGKEGFEWTKTNPYNRVVVYTDGYIRMEILSPKDAGKRSQLMEVHLKALDLAFPADFMAEVRKSFATYNNSSTGMISGSPAQTWAFNDEWRDVTAQYSVSKMMIGLYPIVFSLWFYQNTCPSQYSYCYDVNFPGLTYTGQSSITGMDIEITINP